MKQYSNQQLCRTPKSRVEKVQLTLEHRAARRQFLSQRRIAPSSLEEVFPNISKTRAIIQNAVPSKAAFGNMPYHELIMLATVSAYIQPRAVFEFGTYDGLTTLHLAMNSPETARVFTIDLPPEDDARKVITDDTFYTQDIVVGEQFHDSPEAHKITQIFHDTTRYDHRDLCGKVDLIFVDAGHTYDLAKSDTQKALDMLAPGGIVFWHDYNYTQVGVYTWLNELQASLPLRNVHGSTLIFYVNPKQ